jgi:hypothetical protein
MREIKFDYILETHQQGGHHFDHITFDYAEVFNGIAKRETDLQARIGYKIVAKRLYTGLKDKNGVEIYEGDIYSTDHLNHAHNPYKVVEFDTDAYSADYMEVYGYQFEYPASEIEVIGNIYENPELLEKAS